MAELEKLVKVSFSDEVYESLAKIAAERGVEVSEVVRGALSLEKYVADLRRGGGRVLVQDARGGVREILAPNRMRVGPASRTGPGAPTG